MHPALRGMVNIQRPSVMKHLLSGTGRPSFEYTTAPWGHSMRTPWHSTLYVNMPRSYVSVR